MNNLERGRSQNPKTLAENKRTEGGVVDKKELNEPPKFEISAFGFPLEQDETPEDRIKSLTERKNNISGWDVHATNGSAEEIIRFLNEATGNVYADNSGPNEGAPYIVIPCEAIGRGTIMWPHDTTPTDKQKQLLESLERTKKIIDKLKNPEMIKKIKLLQLQFEKIMKTIYIKQQTLAEIETANPKTIVDHNSQKTARKQAEDEIRKFLRDVFTLMEDLIEERNKTNVEELIKDTLWDLEKKSGGNLTHSLEDLILHTKEIRPQEGTEIKK